MGKNQKKTRSGNSGEALLQRGQHDFFPLHQDPYGKYQLVAGTNRGSSTNRRLLGGNRETDLFIQLLKRRSAYASYRHVQKRGKTTIKGIRGNMINTSKKKKCILLHQGLVLWNDHRDLGPLAPK